jgi:primase-polymerase (primpol)-like protein
MSAALHAVPRAPLTLPANLHWLAVCAQFIVCDFVPSATRPGKTDKRPINPVTLHPCDAHAPANWLACDVAYAKANELSLAGMAVYGVGFVLAPELGVWCLDIDSGLDANSQWRPAIQDLLAKLPGVAWEYSHSGRGLHGWGRSSTVIPAHETRHEDAALGLHLELYSRKRFIALGTAATGEMQPSAALPPALAPLFPSLSAEDAAADSAEWTDEPHPMWHGPTDDDALLAIALASRSKRAMMFPQFAKATFKQLWEADADKLAKHFPADGGYNASQADQAIACHLAFYTGNNWERMAAMIRRSGLNRDKFDRHDYMHRTIGKACRWQKEFYNDGKGIVSGAAIPQSAVSATGIGLEDFYAYLPQKAYMFVPTRELWAQAGLNASIPLVEGKFLPSEWLDRARPLHQMTWAPGEPMVIAGKLVDKGGWIPKDGVNCFNLYRPPLPRNGGDPAQAQFWVDFIRYVYANDAEHLIKYFAHRRQRPGEKINHALVLGGAPGIGKDTMLEPLKHAVGPWNFVEIAPSNLTGEFNGFRKSVVLRISEARDMGDVNRFALYEATKTLLATPPDVLRCNEKNLREHEVFNVMGVVFTTNHKNGLYLPRDDRRHYVAWSEREQPDFREGFWPDMWRWYGAGGLDHVVAYLDAVDLTGFDPKATPPKTTSFWTMVEAGEAPETGDLADALDKLGNPPAVTVEQVVLASMVNPMFMAWLKDPRNSRNIPHRFQDAGYVPVRNPDAQADGRWKVAGRRTPIYAKKELLERDRIIAASELCRASVPPPPPPVPNSPPSH